jgi:hypothetical protein
MDATDIEELDEFARLLARLNEAPPPVPAAAPQPPIESPVVQLQPTISAPAGAPVLAAPAPPLSPSTPPASSTPVAPAFGTAVPFPVLAATPAAAPVRLPTAPEPIGSPPVPPVAAEPRAPFVPVGASPVTRAPELMGADELAAPPRGLPAPPEGTLPLGTPPDYGAPPARVSLSSAPVTAAAPPPAAAAGLASSSSATLSAAPTQPPARAFDFGSLIATPIDAGDASSAPAAPQRFGSTPTDDDEPDLARSTLGEWIGLVLAILVAPIGLIAGIVLAALSARRRGWVVGIVRATIAIGVVLTVVFAIGGYFGYSQFKLQQEHDNTVLASAAFCATLKANPSMDQLPTFGWPAVAASIPDTLKTMQVYEDRWTKLAKVSPPGIEPDVNRVAIEAKKIIDSVTVARTVDDASNVAVMSSIASASGMPAWHSEYCG